MASTMNEEERKRWEAEKLALPSGVEPQELTYAGRWHRPEQGGYRESVHYSGALPNMPAGTMMEHPDVKAVGIAKKYGMDSPQYQAYTNTAMRNRALEQLGTRPESAIDWMNKLIEGGRARDIAQINKEGDIGYASEAARVREGGETTRQKMEMAKYEELLKGKKPITEAGKGDFDPEKPAVETPALPGGIPQDEFMTPATPPRDERRYVAPEGYLESSETISPYLREIEKRRKKFDEYDLGRF